MGDKQIITITVSGEHGTDTSTIMALIANQLGRYDIETTQMPLPGEPVVTGPLRDKLLNIAGKVDIVIVKAQKQRRDRDASHTQIE